MSIKSVYQILKAIDLSYENQNFDLEKTLNLARLKISKHRLDLILESLLSDGYIQGIKFHKFDQGGGVIAGIPELTLRGMDYLENNSSMKQAYKTLKEIKEWIPGM
jgi:hypothetical protein